MEKINSLSKSVGSKFAHLLVFVVMVAIFTASTGCRSISPDQSLKGWQNCNCLRDPFCDDKTAVADYRGYIAKRSAEIRNGALSASFFYFTNSKHQHAVKFIIPLDETWVVYVFVYDQNNHRVSVTKYFGGFHMS